MCERVCVYVYGRERGYVCVRESLRSGLMKYCLVMSSDDIHIHIHIHPYMQTYKLHVHVQHYTDRGAIA